MILIKNIFLNRFDSIIKIKVTGRNINNYVKKLIKSKIDILDLKYISYKEALITLHYNDYLKLLKHKTIYEIEAVERLGKLKIKDNIQKNKILFLMLSLGMVVLFFLSNVVFDIEVIHSKSSIRTLLLEQLEEYGISKYKFKKSYEEIENIEKKILENNKDTLEWIEILESGTKYTVRVQERVINENLETSPYQDIVASKNAVLTKIIATEGEKTKEVNTYVHKGDIVITGSLVHSDGTVSYTSSKGTIYGEVWYNVEIEYPYIYYEEKITGRKEFVYVLNFLNYKLTFFDKDNYKNYNSNDKIILFNNLLPISFLKQEREEVEVIDSIYTEDEALNKAVSLAKEKLLNSNDKIEEIKQVKILDEYNTTNNTIKLKLFISTIEDITQVAPITTNESEDTNTN